MSREAAGAGSVYLHVGEPKTGTTFLQQVMWANRAELLQQGVVYPGPRANAHWRAAQDLRGVRQEPDDPAPPFAGSWDRIVGKVLKAPRVGVISHELLAAANEEQIARAVASLADTELHIVLTVRDLGGLLPAEWQESVKHRNKRPYYAWLSDVIDKESVRADRRTFGFWRVHDTMEILRTWSQEVPPERVHVITMPSRGTSSSLLWERFASVIGVDPAAVDITRVRTNASLGVVEAEMLRRLNEALPETFPNWSYMWFVKDTLAHGPLTARPDTVKLTLPEQWRQWASDAADELVASLKATPYDIVGDLNELLPRFPSEPQIAPRDVPPADLLDAALESMTVLLAKLEAMRADHRAATRTLGKPAHPNRLKAALIEASERHATLERIRIMYWRVANAVRRIRAAGGGTANT